MSVNLATRVDGARVDRCSEVVTDARLGLTVGQGPPYDAAMGARGRFLGS